MPVDLARVDLSRVELQELARLVKARHFELERMMRNVEETEGFDATKHQLRKDLGAQIEVVEDLLVKIEAAVAGR